MRELVHECEKFRQIFPIDHHGHMFLVNDNTMVGIIDIGRKLEKPWATIKV
jgi:hypothetical protein